MSRTSQRQFARAKEVVSIGSGRHKAVRCPKRIREEGNPNFPGGVYEHFVFEWSTMSIWFDRLSDLGRTRWSRARPTGSENGWHSRPHDCHGGSKTWLRGTGGES